MHDVITQVEINLESERRGVVEHVLKVVIDRQKCSPVYRAMICDIGPGLGITMKRLTFASVKPEFEGIAKRVSISEQQVVDLAVKTVGQSSVTLWHKERQLRLSASVKAHRIKTRKDAFVELAQNLVKSKNVTTPDMLYGMRTEPTARR